MQPNSPGPLISFIMTSYRQESIVAEAVESALAQDYSPLEIIFTDDASTDSTFETIRALADRYEGPHKIVLNRNPENLGIAGNVDRAVELSTGELIVVAAGDDHSEPHRCRRVAEAWEASGRRADLIHSSCLQLGIGEGESIETAPPAETLSNPSPMEVADRYLYVIGATLAWTRRLHDRFGPLRGQAEIEDHVIPFRAALTGGYAYIDEPLVTKKPGGVANLAEIETGHDRTYGLYLRQLRWKLADYRQFREDLRHVETPDQREMTNLVEDRIACHAFELKLAEARSLRKLAQIASAARFSWSRRDPRFLWRAAIYATAPVSVWAYDALANIRRHFGSPHAAGTVARPEV